MAKRMPALLTPPTAETRPHPITLHGQTRDDPYAWLRDDNWQEVMREPGALAPDIRTYLDAENAYCKAVMAPTQKLQDALFAEMKGRIREDDSTVPAPDGRFKYFMKYRTGGQHPIFCRKHKNGNKEEILLDGDIQAGDSSYFNIGDCDHSPDHKLIAFSVDDKGSEYFTIALRDTQTGDDLSDLLPGTTGHVAWGSDSRSLFYTTLDDNHRPNKVFLHIVGTPDDKDMLVYEEKDPGFFVGVDKSESGRFILISAHDHETSEVWCIPAHAPQSTPKLIAPRTPGLQYEITDIAETFFILTNADEAEDFAIMTAPINAPERNHWASFIVHRPGCLILSQLAFHHFHVRLERFGGLPRIVVTRLNDQGGAIENHTIAFEEEAFSLSLIPGYEFETDMMRFSYSSPTTPQQVFDYNMKTKKRTLRKTQEVPSGHDPDDYVTRRIMARTEDGADVPVTLLYHRITKLDGTAPVLLYGYGAYGHTIPAGFSTTRLSLVDRGFIYAIAHIRGSKALGYGWYRKGKRDQKINSFTDFIAAGNTLVKQGFTSRGHIVAHGGSAGGMLMGAVANMAPELFRGIIADVPFVDVLNTMCDKTLPLTPPEWPEWGNPITDKNAFEYIKSYSPYDNVSAQSYPHILATAGLTDPRVTYWEPAKWVAKLRATKVGDSLVLLKTNMEAGHAGAAGRFDHLKEIALTTAFALMVNDKG